jgi:hypothetical protein
MPEVQLHVVTQLLRKRPQLVVECGSGTSTMWLGYAAQKIGDCRVVALEHSVQYAEATAELVRLHGLGDIVQVRLAPLATHDVEGRQMQWYRSDEWSDLTDIDVLVVDGPPGSIGRLARYPALPLMGSRLAVSPTIVLDDADRPDERAVIDKWVAAGPPTPGHAWTVIRAATARGLVTLTTRPVSHRLADVVG